MMLRSTLLTMVCGCVSLAGCNVAHSTAPSAKVPSRQFPVIVRLVGRTHNITVYAGPTSPLYSAQAPDGTVIVSNVTLEVLRIHHPELYGRLRPVVAAETALIADMAAK